MAYVPHTIDEKAKMLAATGRKSVSEFFHQIPENVRLKGLLNLPPAMSEQDLMELASKLAGSVRSGLVCFAGAGCYDHFVPAAVDALAGRSEFYTAYTPYQPEISQGVLQAFFEYQTMICELTGLDVSNASMYDGATALAEALLLSVSARKKARKVVISEGVHPDWRAVARTYLRNTGIEVVEVPLSGGLSDPAKLAAAADGAAAVAVQNPNFFGFVEDLGAVFSFAAKAGALSVAAVDPVSLGALESPGALGADVAVGEGQGLGCPLSYGGPHFGFFAAREEYVRNMPGRIVGATVDGQGRRGFVLTFQTREQHIRREKATSNICSNQALMALRATIHLSLLGPAGLAEVANACMQKAALAARKISAVKGFSIAHKAPFFNEFPVVCPVPAEDVVTALLNDGILAGVPVSRFGSADAKTLLVAVTEKRTSEQIDAFCAALAKRF